MGLQRDDELIRVSLSALVALEQSNWRLTEGNRNLRQPGPESLSSPEVEGDTLPSPIVDIELEFVNI